MSRQRPRRGAQGRGQSPSTPTPRLNPCPRSIPSSPALWIEFVDPGRRRAGLPLRPDLADVQLDVHLRPGLPRHLRRRPRRRLLHPRRALRRQGRREAGRRLGRAARRLASGRSAHHAVGKKRPGAPQGLGRDRRRRRAQDPRSSTARASSPTPPTSPAATAARCTTWPCARACTSSRPSRTCAGSCRCAGSSATSSGPTARRTPR